ncbi:hypothetical protein [Larkinella arboricola]
MFLYFSCLSSDGEVLPHTLYADQLEIHLDTLNSFVAFGKVLVAAYLIDDEGHCTDLPIEAFDGWPIADHVLNLQEQYQMVLTT